MQEFKTVGLTEEKKEKIFKLPYILLAQKMCENAGVEAAMDVLVEKENLSAS